MGDFEQAGLGGGGRIPTVGLDRCFETPVGVRNVGLAHICRHQMAKHPPDRGQGFLGGDLLLGRYGEEERTQGCMQLVNFVEVHEVPFLCRRCEEWGQWAFLLPLLYTFPYNDTRRFPRKSSTFVIWLRIFSRGGFTHGYGHLRTATTDATDPTG